jgi:hypothetical protein
MQTGDTFRHQAGDGQTGTFRYTAGEFINRQGSGSDLRFLAFNTAAAKCQQYRKQNE